MTEHIAEKPMSPPVRGRGLKPRLDHMAVDGQIVAPPAGAWIETSYPPTHYIMSLVAPRAGAWIETG
jgi:hypothetical protein